MSRASARAMCVQQVNQPAENPLGDVVLDFVHGVAVENAAIVQAYRTGEHPVGACSVYLSRERGYRMRGWKPWMCKVCKYNMGKHFIVTMHISGTTWCHIDFCVKRFTQCYACANVGIAKVA